MRPGHGAARSISALDELLQMARAEPGPARLLTVLLKAEPVLDRHADTDPEQASSGLLKPVAVKAHALEELGDSASLLADVAGAGTVNWHFLMVGVLPGSLVGPPTDDLVDEQLKNMARSVHTGDGMNRYAFFDRDGDPIMIGLPQ